MHHSKHAMTTTGGLNSHPSRAYAVPTPRARTLCPPWQSDWAKNKWKGAVFVITVATLGTYIPWFAVSFAQRKAGVW